MMNINLNQIIDSFKDIKVTVLGDPILDVYIEGSCDRLCREAPAPVVLVNSINDVPGGAANVAVNAAALGSSVRLLGLTADDPEGKRLSIALKRLNVSAGELISVNGRTSIVKHRLVGDSQILARFDKGTPENNRADIALLCDAVKRALDDSDVFIVSDYGYGTVSAEILKILSDRPSNSKPYIVADGRDLVRLAQIHPTAVKPSYEEITHLLGEHPASTARLEWVNSRGARILNMTSSQIAAVTLDSDGALVLEKGLAPYRTFSRPEAISRTTGCGDTFVAAFSLALAAGADTPESAEIASAAAAVVSGKEGTASCSADDLRTAIAGEKKYLNDCNALHKCVAAVRACGRRIVFTNGCFDILHRGHVTLLNKAKGLGDILIVGLNSDASVRRLKGRGRPVNELNDRIKILSSLSYVDYIISFDSDSPREIIDKIRPDIYVKGGNYSRETLRETGMVESLGGVVCILPLFEDISTSGLIERIRSIA